MLGLAALVAGVAVGFVGGAFRWRLAQAGVLRDQVSAWSHTTPLVG